MGWLLFIEHVYHQVYFGESPVASVDPKRFSHLRAYPIKVEDDHSKASQSNHCFQDSVSIFAHSKKIIYMIMTSMVIFNVF